MGWIFLYRNIVSIHQPNLFPRIKVLQKIFHSDTYICYDDVQFVRNDWQNRVFIRNIKDLRLFWLSIPVVKPNGQKSKINEVNIHEQKKIIAELRCKIEKAYASSKHWSEIQAYVEPAINVIYEKTSISEFLYLSLKSLINLLCPQTKIIRSSEISDALSIEKNMRLIELCNLANATGYICGSGGLKYIDESMFELHGINLLIQDWNEDNIKLKYDNLHWRNVSFIDFWARYGLEELKNILGGSL